VLLLGIVWAVLKFVVWPAATSAEEVGLLAPLASKSTSSSGGGEEGAKTFTFKKKYSGV
jgi:hypothetical protein